MHELDEDIKSKSHSRKKKFKLYSQHQLVIHGLGIMADIVNVITKPFRFGQNSIKN